MIIKLVCKEGPRKGDEFVVKETISIGRSQGDLQLKDAKASSLHAKIFNNNEGLVQIEDLGSSNGTVVNGSKINGPTTLKVGDLITIGKTKLEVLENTARGKESDLEKGSWQEKVELALDGAWAKAEKKNPKKKASIPFELPVVLDFVQGLQAGQTYIFGFGPRQVGLHCSNALISEEGILPIAFELFPEKDALCELRTLADNIKVNDTSVKKQKLKNGDRISFGQTVIIVRAYKTL
jgi:pSer/pThr/pTyr-binding forkhead associated (FHA) protein